MPYPFFLSYARKDSRIENDPARPDPHFETFLQRLTMRVDQLTGDQGFCDRTDILSGQDWPDRLAEALRSGKTMVCLYSPSYFRSEYCGKEMQILLDRRRRYIRENSGKKPANIIPVLWHPTPGKIPKTLPEIQYEAPNLDPKIYGAWNLGDLGRDRELKEFADQIAIRVRDASDDTPLPELEHRPALLAARNAFLPPPLPLPEFDSPEAAAGPAAVTFVYSSVTQWNAWPWAPPEDRAVLHLSSAIAKGKEMEPNQLAFGAEHSNMLQRLSAASQRNNVVVFLVDAASLAVEGLRVRMKEYDRQKYSRFATMIIWKNKPAPNLVKEMNETFDYCAKRTPPYFHSVEGRDQFSQALSQTLEALKLEIANDPFDPNRIPDATDFPNLPTVSRSGLAGTF